MNKTLLESLQFFCVLSVLFLFFSFLSKLIFARTSVQDWYQKIEKQGHGRGNVLATLFGAVTPFCVCTTVPIFVGMLQMGVATNAAISFLLASPLVNVSTVVLLGYLFGIKYSIFFTAVVLIFSILGGFLVGYLKLDNEVTENSSEQAAGCDRAVTCKEAAHFSVTLFKNLFVPLLAGAIIAGFIHNYVPVTLVSQLNQIPVILLIPVMAVIGFPLYINILALTPICFSLVEKGMNPAAVMTFMLAGAGISLPTTLVLARLLKPRLWMFYLGYTFVAYCLSGFLFYWVG